MPVRGKGCEARDGCPGDCRTSRHAWCWARAHACRRLVLAGGDAERQRSARSAPSLSSTSTPKSLTVTFKTDGRYDADALKQLNHFMRDWRRDVSREMDPELIDLIWTLHAQLGSGAGQAHLGLPFGDDQQQAPAQGRRPGQEQPAHPRQGSRHPVPRRAGEDAPQLGAHPGMGRRRLLPDLGRPLRACRHRPRAHVAAHRPPRARGALPRGKPNICRPTASRSPRKIISCWRRACLAATRCSPLSGRRRNRQPSQPSRPQPTSPSFSLCSATSSSLRSKTSRSRRKPLLASYVPDAPLTAPAVASAPAEQAAPLPDRKRFVYANAGGDLPVRSRN